MKCIKCGQEVTVENELAALSERELQIVKLSAKGLGDTAIGHEIYRSVKTVATHKARLKIKLGIASQEQWMDFLLRVRAHANG